MAENEIAGPIQNAVQALDPVAGEALLDRRDDRHPAGNRGAVKQLAAVQPGQLLERNAVFGNQLLVGSDYVPACRQRLTTPFARGLQTTRRDAST
jgi:hypothetical protein